MTELIAAHLGALLGALFITFVLTRLIYSRAKKKTDPTKAAFIAFLVVTVIVFIITRLTSQEFLIYIICLVIWLTIDIIRAKRSSESSHDEEVLPSNIEAPQVFMCPHCGAKYNPNDYREDASEWFCSECRKQLPKK